MPNVYLPEGFYFGVSAATGALHDAHWIHRVDVRVTEAAHAEMKAENEVLVDDAPTPEEIEGVDSILRETKVVRAVLDHSAAQGERLKQLGAHVESEIAALQKKLADAAQKLQESEMSLQMRVGRLLDAFDKNMQAKLPGVVVVAGSWIYAFSAVVVVFALGLLFLWRKYEKAVKLNLD
jgi:hypothetical protein